MQTIISSVPTLLSAFFSLSGIRAWVSSLGSLKSPLMATKASGTWALEVEGADAAVAGAFTRLEATLGQNYP